MPDRSPVTGSRRGRRSGSASSRDAILDAARTEFAALGYRRATVRRIATAAGVDPAMINHHFGGKDALFSATLDLPFSPAAEIARAAAGPRDGLGERLVTRLLELWDASAGPTASSVLRTALEHDGTLEAVRAVVVEALVRVVPAEGTDPDEQRARWRATLAASQLLGLVMGRYLLGLGPLATAPRAEVVRGVAPTVQRYLAGPLD
ncbi:AcrR family transcriptional regulator [Friedmanniella endophytica]|uniref:AcrR family transcriptional regulator n=1 Tax=Microlunatus kandeliicorticis TaxID=1759536 RepID=A0A7W3IQ37_9ACTN|nr:TetR family transcriptional regulator [Microlunatus kandeliicorticis]MBA8793163.1 AcrR family transcriptional regulator [Microlunatus kandeliicorticis]